VTIVFHHCNTPYGNTIYEDFLLVFYDIIFIFVINVRAKSLSLVTYDEDQNFVIER
jgi:hypothetical protein